MGEMEVEHVLLFLVGAFLVYYMMGKCRRVEGSTGDIPNCNGNPIPYWGKQLLHPSSACLSIDDETQCENSYDEGKSFWHASDISFYGVNQCKWEGGSCQPGDACAASIR